ncbi:hypothetical protein MP638_000209 [Amoeboaphelidium occidentale]|nr:hypothetical protein MP638_000209 [Amoeboaphelidium occidentale]
MPINFYLPNIKAALVVPRWKLRPRVSGDNQLLFRFPRFMTKIDIKNYLGAMYNAKVLRVDTFVEARKKEPHPLPHLFARRMNKLTPYKWKPMTKMAYVSVESDFSVLSEDEQDTRKYEEEKEKKERMDIIYEYRRNLKHNYAEIVQREHQSTSPVPVDIKPSPPIQNKPLNKYAIVKGSAKNRVFTTQEAADRYLKKHPKKKVRFHK